MGSEGSKQEEKHERGSAGPVIDRAAELEDGIVQMESLIKKAAALVAEEARRVEEIKEALAAGVAALEARLAERDEALRQKDSVLKEVEEGLTARIRELEGQLTKKEGRNGEDRDPEGRAPQDTEVKLIRRSMRGIVVRDAGTAGRQEGQEPRKSGLASLLAPSKRKS
jgi:hypothetical protein